MAEQTQEEGGIGVSGLVGGVAGGAAAGHFTQRHLANKGIAAVLANKEPTDKFVSLVKDAYSADIGKAAKDSVLTEPKRALRALKKLNPNNIKEIIFEASNGSHTMMVELKDGASHFIDGIKQLPAGVKAGEAVAADKIAGLFEGDKSFVKTTIAKMEGQLANGIRKASGYFSGFKAVGGAGKVGIIGATVAGVAAGGYALNAMFGGKHTARVEAKENAPAAGQAR